MPTTQAKVATPLDRVWRIVLRAAGLVVVAMFVGWVSHRAVKVADRGGGPAGFGYGVAHGALMPLALPNLLVGRDVPIYAANNTGLSYKLGYTVGVNGCGAIFFGVCYWRVNRWRKRNRTPGT